MVNIVQGVITLNKFVWSIFWLGVVVMFVYAVFLILRYGYIRPFVLGHSEPFENYMETYMKDFIEITNKILKHKDGTQLGCFSQIQQFFNTYKQISGVDLSSEEISSGEFTPKTLPFLYLLYIFYEAIGGEGYKPNEELSMMSMYVDRHHVEKYYKERNEVDEPHKIKDVEELVGLRNTFNTLRDAVKNDSNTLRSGGLTGSEDLSVHVFVFKLMLDDYFDNIIMSYNLRKPIGYTNVLVKIYVAEYSEYIFKEMIPDIWESFGDDIKGLADGYTDFIASEESSTFMSNLPLMLAGVEPFGDESDSGSPPTWKPASWNNMWEKMTGIRTRTKDSANNEGSEIEQFQAGEEEVHEHFIQALNAIAKTFIGLFKIVIAVVNVITDPIAFIRWILGLSIGITIYIIYLLLVILSFIFIIPAFIIVFIYDWFMTIFMFLLWIGVAVLYMILGIIDTFTGGFILASLKCENLPTAWHTYSGYAKENKFVRKFFCRWRCAKRYVPVGAGCKKLPTYEPSYCPHQLIYNAYWENFDQLRTAPYIYHYKPTIDYYINNNVSERKAIWKTVYDGRKEFKNLCADKMGNYNHIIHTMCRSLNKNEKFKSMYPDQHTQIMNLCEFTYCQDTNEFCDQKDLTTEEKTKNDIITTFTLRVICLLLIIMFASAFLQLV